MTERVLNLVTYIQWEKTQVIEYDKICNGLKALSEILSIYSYIIIGFIGQAVLEEKIFENGDEGADGRTDDGRTPDHGHPISSPCEPYGSGELKYEI